MYVQSLGIHSCVCGEIYRSLAPESSSTRRTREPDSYVCGHLKTAVLQILKEDLGKRNLCASFVPYCLKPDKREGRVTPCQDIIAMADADKNFLAKF
jgi:hypothetical protein